MIDKGYIIRSQTQADPFVCVVVVICNDPKRDTSLKGYKEAGCLTIDPNENSPSLMVSSIPATMAWYRSYKIYRLYALT